MSGRSPRRGEIVGVLGGTFDPVHDGHTRIASSVRSAFGLGRVLLVPCAVPPHKSRVGLADSSHRLAMLRLAVEGLEGLEVSTVEIERGGPSYTIDTLRALRTGPPPLRPLLIVGWDAFLDLPSWHLHRKILEEFDVVAVRRLVPETPERSPDPAIAARVLEVPVDRGAAAKALSRHEAESGRVFRLPIEPLPVSSRQIRELVAAGKPISGLVPAEVARYIQDHRLYERKEERS